MKWNLYNESNSVPQELRTAALRAYKILKNNATLDDVGLKQLIRRANTMHREEIANAAQDLLDYRNAAKGIEGDRVGGSFVGIAAEAKKKKQYDLKKIDGKTVKQWYKWLKKEDGGCCHLSIGETAEHDICICMGWTDTGDEYEIAWKIGQQTFNNGMQTDLDIDFDMPYDPKTGEVYDTSSVLWDLDPKTADWDAIAAEMNDAAEGAYEFACEIDGQEEQYDEGKITEDTQSELLEMGDRVDELEAEIERLWRRLGDLPGDKDEIVLQLISRYVELEKIEPGRVDF